MLLFLFLFLYLFLAFLPFRLAAVTVAGSLSVCFIAVEAPFFAPYLFAAFIIISLFANWHAIKSSDADEFVYIFFYLKAVLKNKSYF